MFDVWLAWKGAGLPIGFQLGLSDLLERNAHQVSWCCFHFKHPLGKLGQFTFKPFLALDGLLNGHPDLLADDALEITWFRQLAVYTGRAYFKRVAFARDRILFV